MQVQVDAPAAAAKRWEAAIPSGLRVKFDVTQGGQADILALSALSGLDDHRFMLSAAQTNEVELVHMALAFMVRAPAEMQLCVRCATAIAIHGRLRLPLPTAAPRHLADLLAPACGCTAC